MRVLVAILAAFALYFGLILLAMQAGAVELQVTGHSAGHGLQVLNFSGDLLNVSLAQNGTSWNLTLGGRA